LTVLQITKKVILKMSLYERQTNSLNSDACAGGHKQHIREKVILCGLLSSWLVATSWYVEDSPYVRHLTLGWQHICETETINGKLSITIKPGQACPRRFHQWIDYLKKKINLLVCVATSIKLKSAFLQTQWAVDFLW